MKRRSKLTNPKREEAKMKVGIMSMQRVCNYGSFLQAYALMKTIESFGIETTFVDYKIGKPLPIAKSSFFYRSKKRISRFCLSLLVFTKVFDFMLPKQIKKEVVENRLFRESLATYLNVKNKKNYHASVDVLVVGSDEVFNCTQKNPQVGYSLELFGKSSNSSKIISYAASFGNTTIKRLIDAGKDQEIKRYLSGFSNISVRDYNSFDIVKKLIDKDPCLNIDPVLLYDFKEETKRFDDQCQINEFVIVYAYRGRLLDEEKIEIINYSKKHGKKIVCIGGYQDFGDINIVGEPFLILSFFKKADFVFTDTFHGTIMSIINRRQFVTFVRKSVDGVYGNEEKIISLLSLFGLEGRIVNNINGIDGFASSTIDYETVFSILEKEREAARKYLAVSLGVLNEKTIN